MTFRCRRININESRVGYVHGTIGAHHIDATKGLFTLPNICNHDNGGTPEEALVNLGQGPPGLSTAMSGVESRTLSNHLDSQLLSSVASDAAGRGTIR